MASSRNNMSILGIFAVAVLIGLAVYFIAENNDNDLEINIGLMHDSPAELMVG